MSQEADREFQRVWRSRGKYLMAYTRTDVLPQVITPGVYSHTLSNVNLFKVPHRLTILFMDQQQQMGGRYEVGGARLYHNRAATLYHICS
jgi:hypothetical protein